MHKVYFSTANSKSTYTGKSSKCLLTISIVPRAGRACSWERGYLTITMCMKTETL